jgi:hypothetical protein
MQTTTSWPAMQLRLEAIRQEYTTLCQEIAAESDPEHRAQLQLWAAACRREWWAAAQEWRDQTSE